MGSRQWYIVMGCMARFSFDLSYFFVVDTVAMGGNKSKKQKKIFRPYLYHDVHLERRDYMVDMECIGDRGSYGFFGQ